MSLLKVAQGRRIVCKVYNDFNIFCMLIFILILLSVILALILLGKDPKIQYLYAGKPEQEKFSDISQKELKDNNEFLFEDGTIIDWSAYTAFVIRGISLAPEKILDKTIVLAKMIPCWFRWINRSKYWEYIKKGKFIILKNDSKRSKKEYPDRKVLSGIKIRRVVSPIKKGLKKDDFLSILKDENIPESSLERIYGKYDFACNYYKRENKLILSVTYKSTGEKDLSFHSIKFLRGIVKYVTHI